VVQEALEMTWCLGRVVGLVVDAEAKGHRASAGAEMMTFTGTRRCFLALGPLREKADVDSQTISRADGSPIGFGGIQFTLKTLKLRPLPAMES